ncbi:lipopolysaccharide kinase InaA family protein [Pseudomonas mangiferae]|uniref:Toluene tolerance protein n=1 Tax=Pseudomonas mangiferae TaxID=2593654 RepID=A0A553GX25_9PSED|nr:lipopolysaccharide kinase InaA family protein [Pseudomonas mangiferae]TRX74049.1 toluene tolerance protein [Pseudomonas mangiferae]
MRIVTANELQDWLSQGELLEKDSLGPKVVKLASGELLKIFRARGNRLLNRLRPAACRFQAHAERLQALGIHTPRVIDCYWLDRPQAVSACLYHPLVGQPLDTLFRHSRADFDQQVPALARYILELHRRGIYFRSLHLGNILLTPVGEFGLIDFLDIRFKGRPLGRPLVQRNFEHLRSYLQRRKVEDFPWERLMRCYAEASSASS